MGGEMTKSGETGPAEHGSGHWMLMHYTSAGSLITCAYLVVSFLLLPDLSYSTLTGWLQGLGPSFALGLLIVAVFWHARLGLQVLVEDYVHQSGTRFAAMLVINLAAFAGAAFGLLCLLRIGLSGAA